MKKLVLALLVLLMFLADSSRSQTIRTYGLKFALTSSGQIRNYSFFNDQTYRRMGINLGIYAEIMYSPNLSIITQLEYCQRGFGDKWTLYIDEGVPQNAPTVTLYDRLDYLSVPMLAKYSWASNNIKPYVLFGPRFDFLVGKKLDRPGPDPVYDKFKKPVFGATLGVGVNPDLGLPISLSLEARYNFDIMTSYSTPDLTIRNDAFDIWIGVGI